ncbi:hypothetical protein PAXINDRAFT_99726 [Paxillus involutus ATCC 200175]|uniref:U6 snRNA phosphodiesterase 1 n=1 Tax=Paxillus involutus ATCC 200175 TaxID=664439 RepID=A0A0C9U655_PAXIN|nr:hypothetical protein PAXINDRAFT_99726 [Paxillus involutus ATCC 200175]
MTMVGRFMIMGVSTVIHMNTSIMQENSLRGIFPTTLLETLRREASQSGLVATAQRIQHRHRDKRYFYAYSSSEDDEKPINEPLQPKKKRKLPTLSSSLTIPTPIDNPALHQGRVRTVPHVEGQYATYIYVPLVLHPKDVLYTLLEDVLTFAKEPVPSLHAIGRQSDGQPAGVRATRWELHISLSRPLFLRAHQREEFKRAIQQVASSLAPFDASFATFSELTNDERTRTFLALEVGAGHVELRRCLDLLSPTLRLLRQKEFYADPKFHASIAWALLERMPSPFHSASLSTTGALDEIALDESPPPGDEAVHRSTSPPTPTAKENFDRIPHFPHGLVPSLNQAYAGKLSEARTGGFVVDRISVKIGKDIFTWPLKLVRSSI